MSMITIQKSELDELGGALKEKDLIIAEHVKTIEKQQAVLDIQQGIMLYNDIIARKILLVYWELLDQVRRITPEFAISSKHNSVKMIEDVQDSVKASVERWDKFLEEHEGAKTLLAGHLPALPAVLK